MPINPMQRRARNSFLTGFLIALIIMALVILALLYKMKSINEAKEALEALQVSMFVTTEDLESGQSVTMESFMMQKVQTTLDPTQVVSEEDFMFYNENGEQVPKYNEDGTEKQKEMVMKVSVPAGTIVTKDMLAEVDEGTTDDQRIQEYNMILLPSQLKEGDYVDVRLSLPKGQDYIVVAKKKVIKTNATGIWLKLTEDEILTLGNAIVEAYAITGSKIYAIQYSEPGLQSAATPTYPVSAEVLSLMDSDPNMLQKAKEALYNRYFANNQAQAAQRNNYINPAIAENINTMNSNVEAKTQEEVSKIQAAREEYISSLEGE